jgi:hypothetical protein
MSPSTDTPNVVDLQPRQSGGGERLGELLRLVRNIAQTRLGGLVSTLFENVDDALFDLAEKAESNAVQTRFFDGMREVRKKRQLVERRFNEQLAHTFADFSVGTLRPARPDVPTTSNAGLALVDDQELEESLALSSMISKGEGRLVHTLYQVNRRLSVIVGGVRVEDADNPIGPAVLCTCFRQAVAEFDLAIEVKLIVYKLFDRYVMAGLDTLYDEVNGELVRAGVLPQIRHQLPQGSRPVPAAAGTGSAGEHDPAMRQDAMPDIGTGELQIELYNTLRALLAGRREPPYAGIDVRDGHVRESHVAHGEPGEPRLSPTTLLSALNILQGQIRSRPEPVDGAAMVRELKQELFEEVRRFGGGAKAGHVSAADEDTIDLVGMLFEYILQDRNLPAQIQALLGRLQIPYLKVAIVDKHLFAQKAHPARRLLDALAEAGLGWSEEADADHRLIDRIKQSVQAILRNFDDDVGAFERELVAFEEFMDRHRRRSQVAELRAAEAARGREKLHAARHTVAREIVQCVGDQHLPPVVRAILARPWANYLVLTLLRHGHDSQEWDQGLRFAGQFVWSTLPKTTESERTRLRELLPWFEQMLRLGLATVAYHEHDLVRLMRDLTRLYRQLLGDDSVVLHASDADDAEVEMAADESAPSAVVAEAEGALDETDETLTQSGGPFEEIVLATAQTEENEPTDNYPPDDEFLQRARDLALGTWVEFIDDGRRERAKLSWISPISSRLLFVNRRGLKICDKTVYAVAADLRRGACTVLADVPLFDRALGAIVERLRQNPAPGPTPAPAS